MHYRDLDFMLASFYGLTNLGVVVNHYLFVIRELFDLFLPKFYFSVDFTQMMILTTGTITMDNNRASLGPTICYIPNRFLFPSELPHRYLALYSGALLNNFFHYDKPNMSTAIVRHPQDREYCELPH